MLSRAMFQTVLRDTPWCNGSTTGFGPVSPGSNPGGVAILHATSNRTRCAFPSFVYAWNGRSQDHCPRGASAPLFHLHRANLALTYIPVTGESGEIPERSRRCKRERTPESHSQGIRLISSGEGGAVGFQPASQNTLDIRSAPRQGRRLESGAPK